MRIIVDLDATVVDIHGPWHKRYNELSGDVTPDPPSHLRSIE